MEKVTAVKPVLSGIAHGLSRQRGASLLEGIAYLGIAAIVVLGAVSLLTNAFGSAKANQTTEELISLRTSVRKLYTGQKYVDESLLPTVIGANVVPNTLVVSGTTVKNSWTGDIEIKGSTDGTTFTIAYYKLPKDVCVSVVSGANGWTNISNGTAAKDIKTFPAAAKAAADICASDNNTITFTAT